MNTQNAQLIVVDLSSQYTLVIARVLTSLGYRTRVIKPEEIVLYLKQHKPKGIILSGSGASVYNTDAPQLPNVLWESDVPILGICYGMQYMAYRDDKDNVAPGTNAKEYGPVSIELTDNLLFQNVPKPLSAWASHGDAVIKVPQGYCQIASSENTIQGIMHETFSWFGVQFHPEVIETKDNDKILENFAKLICGCEVDWYPQNVTEEVRNFIVDAIGPNGKGLFAVSGGVDSTTLAAMCALNLKDRMHACFIDTGAMREGEVEEVVATCQSLGINLVVEYASELFFAAMHGVSDAEMKRDVFKKVYQQVLRDVIQKYNITTIVQGTLATDKIESGAAGKSKKIKGHHNVGLKFGIPEIEPFGNLFKHEVRNIARFNNLSISERQPFPGPGLFLRVVGFDIITPEIIAVARKADFLVMNVLKEEGVYNSISQLIVGVFNVKTVGVQGDERSYHHPVVIRAVTTSDFMTVSGVEFSSVVKRKIFQVITGAGLTNRVLWDENPKPPATTEFE